MGKTKYSRKNLVGKKKNITMKKKYPKKQKGKKLKNNKKIKMKKKANKIKRKYSLKVKKQRGGSDNDDNNVPTTCSLCLNDIDSNAIIVSKPNKDGDCPKGFKKEGDFCVSTNIKDSKTTNPDAPVETNSKQNSNLPSPSAPFPPIATPVTTASETDVPVAVAVATPANATSESREPVAVATPANATPANATFEPHPLGTSTLNKEKQSEPSAAVYSVPSPRQSSGNKTNNALIKVNAKDPPPIEVKETTVKSLFKSAANKAKKSRNNLTAKIGHTRNEMVAKINESLKPTSSSIKK